MSKAKIERKLFIKSAGIVALVGFMWPGKGRLSAKVEAPEPAVEKLPLVAKKAVNAKSRQSVI